MKSRRIRRIALGGGAALLVLGALGACMHLMSKPPADLDYSSMRRSARGTYAVTIAPEVSPPPRGRVHQWTVQVKTADGETVDTARIQVWGGMPQHGHGLPTRPQVVRALGNGEHLVDGMKFNMGGWWVVKFAIAAAAGTDTVTFNLAL